MGDCPKIKAIERNADGTLIRIEFKNDAMFPKVVGRCPACGYDTLFLGTGGFVTCSLQNCPNPAAASDALKGKQA
jgi:hypothetical protein